MAGFSALKPADQEQILARVPATAGGAAGEGGLSPELQEQNKRLFEVLDLLKSLSDVQLKDMLELNGYPTKRFPPGTVSPAELCADGILFGAVVPCAVCSTDDHQSRLLLSTDGGDSYKCKGWINKFLRCTVRTQAPERTEWVLSEAAKACGGGALKKMKLKTGTRVFAHPLPDGPGAAAEASGPRPALLGLQVVLAAAACTEDMTREQLAAYVHEHGGAVAEEVSSAVSAVVSTAEAAEAKDDEVVARAEELKVPGVAADFLTESVKEGDLVDMEPHLLWGKARERRTPFRRPLFPSLKAALLCGHELAGGEHIHKGMLLLKANMLWQSMSSDNL
ncbi:unnamed protein product [Prorocentrum cordatum]|uniref:BRCT domain-containing protein n=1 Tax=Prorocentrum cordatum TaxID=2364126 RepID=A0ABN9PTK8_9DINO|nr:unnamed protein product [Polarella glacialis]